MNKIDALIGELNTAKSNINKSVIAIIHSL